MSGGAGDDWFHCAQNARDTLYGDGGTDHAVGFDSGIDLLFSIETRSNA